MKKTYKGIFVSEEVYDLIKGLAFREERTLAATVRRLIMAEMEREAAEVLKDSPKV